MKETSVPYYYRLSTLTRLKSMSPVLIFLAIFLCIPSVCWAQQRNADQVANAKDIKQLTALTRDAIETQNDILVSGEVEKSLAQRPAAARFRQGIAKHFEVLVRRNKALTAQKSDYKSHRTQVTINDVKVEGDKAIVTATEYVVLALAPVPDAPDQTEYYQDHVLEFVNEGNKWTLVSDSVPPPPQFPEPADIPILAPPLEEAPADYIPEARQQAIRKGNNSPWVKASYAVSSPPMYTSYNGTAAAVYAYTYWSTYNSQYRTYSNDCTNFTSQALRYGGWPMDTVGSRTGSDTWYYGSFTATTSYSWAAAHNFFWFWYYSGRGYLARYYSDLNRGDIVQADWGPSPDGTVNHTMLVTKKDSLGRLYLTYHTNNTKDKPLADIQAEHPGTRFYGEKMYSSF